MRRFLGIIMSLLICFSSFAFNITEVKAEGEHQFLIQAYDWNALDNDWEGSGTGDELTSNSDVEPGQVIQVVVYYVPGTDTDVAMQIGLKYDNTLVEPMYYEGEIYVETDMSTTYQGGIWPAAGTSPALKKQTNWSVLYNDYTDETTGQSQVNLVVSDETNAKPLETEGIIASVYFKVKDDAPAGAVLDFSYDEDYTKLNNKSARTISGLTLNVFGTMSTDTALDTLSVSNGSTIYPLNPEFVSGNTSVKDFNVVVPNQIDSVDISATALNEYTTIPSGTGTKTLNVGENEVTVLVQAQNGTQEFYTINIYRLSNDATLSSLTLTNDINIGTFTSSKTDYTALVPYKTSQTNVSATATHENAVVESGTGLWTLANSGTTLNTKNIVVKAENCDTQYASVEGNTCTTKTYKIDITRTAASTNTNLSDLKINDQTVSGFSSGTYTYTLDDVSNDTTTLKLGATVEDTGKATITTALGTYNLNVGDNTLKVTVKAENGDTKDYTVNVRRLSNDSSLSSLTVTSTPSGTLSPSFSSTLLDYYTYTAPSTVQKVTVAATVTDTDNATIVSGPGEYDIDTTPTVNVTVQAEDGSTSIYVVKLVREKSSNNNLSSLSIDGYTLNETFAPDKTLYTADVSGEVTSIDVSAIVEDTGKATIISGTGTHNLDIGTNTIQVRVQAENGTIKDYTITVTRAKKTISALSDLKVDGVTVPDFNEKTLSYTLDSVPFEKTSVLIEATPKDADSTVKGTGTVNLKTGVNKLYVTVTAQDGTTQTPYIINIERAKDDNAYLSDLQIDGVTIADFNKNTTEYSLTVENTVLSLNLNAIAESDAAEVTVSGNVNFVTTKDNKVTITVTSESGNIKIYTITVTRKKSDNVYLKSINLSDGLLNPTFDKTVNSYTVDVDRSVTAMTITATPEDSTATYKVSGPTTLAIGENTFTITVTSESGLENVYSVVVKRNPSSNNYLSNLTIDGTTVEGFVKIKELYTINVDSTKQNIVIGASAEDSYATITGDGTFNLVSGVNTFPVVVKAENGATKTYSIVVNKSKSNDSSLSSLAVVQSTISPTFSSNVLSYTSAVAYSVTNVDITATATDSKATIVGTGNKDLNTGENTFEIVVTAEDNTTTTYKIVITRAKNNNANLSNIVLSGGFTLTPTFNSDTTTYSVDVPNATDNLTITAYKQDPNAVSVTGAGTVSLNTGMNQIQIVVTAEDGKTTKTYTLNIDREKSSDATLSSLTVDSGTLTPAFDKDVDKYEVIVPNEVENLGINATTTSDAASVSITGNTSLTVGTNDAKVTVTAEDGTIKVYTVQILRQPSSNNFLSALSVKDVNSYEYIDTFLKTKLEYNITVENNIDKVTIDATREDTDSILKGTGEKTLDIGDNSFDVTVTSASGITRTYVVNVTRKANSNAFLSSLEVVGQTLSPDFNKNQLSYTVNVDSLVDKITINATSEVSTSTVNGTGDFTLVTGPNNFNIDVTSEDGTVKTYVIVVNKQASNNNYLSNLAITPGTLTPDFNKDTLSYNVHVDNDTTTMTIVADKEHPAATVTGDGVKSLSVGAQTFDIEVKAENNETRTYKITVERDASSNNDLSDLTIDGETVEGFNKDLLKYEISVDNSVESINIGAVKVDETATVTGTGNISLNTGKNTLNVTVTAEDGTIKIYELEVTRAKSSNNYLSALSVKEGTLSPDFAKEVLSYSITVPYEVTSLTIDAQKEDSAAVIEIDSNNNFVVGANKVYVNVIAEDGTVRTYTINVTRQQQANNFLTSIIVTGDDSNRYSLSPDFDKETLAYTVEIPSTMKTVDIQVTKEAMSLSVTGDGTVTIDSFPKVHKIVVSTTGGLERTYTITFTKGLSSNADLSSLSVDKGTLSPAFDKDELAYNVDLPATETQITISATKAETAQTITGLGTFNLTSGRNTFKVTVTAENGIFKVYTIFVNVAEDASNTLDSLTVDKGTLSPTFDKTVKNYTVDLDASETEITINATGKNTITGIGTFDLSLGANTFEVVSTDDNGIKNTYVVVVNRGSITSKYLQSLMVEGYTLEEEFAKDKLNYNLKIINPVSTVNVLATPEDKNATVVITGNNNLKVGENTINITVTDANGESLTYTINVWMGHDKITSDIHTITNEYISTIKENTTAGVVKSEMKNPAENLKVYNLEGIEISDTDVVGSGYVIKLIINGKEYDSKILIVKGDINCNGEVEVADFIMLKMHILETNNLADYQIYAADINNDDDSGVADMILLKSHILGSINIFEKESE